MKPIIDIRSAIVDKSVETLGDNYTDVVEGMLYANAAMLIDFVENERGGIDKVKDISWLLKNGDDSSIIQASTDLEIARLYCWWKERRIWLLAKKAKLLTLWSHFKHLNDEGLTMLNEPDSPDAKEAWDAMSDIENLYELECEDFLVSLMKIRGRLWT